MTIGSTPVNSKGDHIFSSKLSAARLVLLGLQHVLVMYVGTVAVPLVVGSALKLPKEALAFLISADLFAAGIVTLIQSLGLWGFGIRMPVMMGVTFAAVGPMIAIGLDPQGGLPAIYGAVIAAGLFGTLMAPIIARLLRFFPPLVTGTMILLIGLSLIDVGINWSAGGSPTISQTAGFTTTMVPNPAYGELAHLAIAGAVLLAILFISRFGKKHISNIAVLLGVASGIVLSMALGKMNLQSLADAPWVALITPMHFGPPKFALVPVITMCLVMLIIMIESTGMFLALAEITEIPMTQDALTRGLRADALGAVIGGLFNTFPYTSFSQNVGLVSVTGVRSRYVTAIGGGILILLGLFPRMALFVASIPQYVLGGACIVIFGTIAATGIRVLSGVDFEKNRSNLFIVGVSLTIGMIPTLAPSFFQYLPSWSNELTHSGIVLGTIIAVVFNLCFNGVSRS